MKCICFFIICNCFDANRPSHSSFLAADHVRVGVLARLLEPPREVVEGGGGSEEGEKGDQGETEGELPPSLSAFDRRNQTAAERAQAAQYPRLRQAGVP